MTNALGATYLGNGRCQFVVWAPFAGAIEVRVLSHPERLVPMEPIGQGYYQTIVDSVEPGDLYVYRLNDDTDRPDPASRSQPAGIHNPSQVIDPEFPWEDSKWCGLPLQDYVIYEIHTGCYTPEGTFDGIIPHLDELKDLGITAVELMPVAQFPGTRNWGYDGVHPFAVQNTYGGPFGLKRLVNACHLRGLAVILDVVYNHLGPEGNYLGDFGPYFTNRYKTPWGSAINFDGPHSDEVRHFFIENALSWVTEYHIDGLRLDAVHAIFDFSARTFFEELAEIVHGQADRLTRRVHLIAESNLNDSRFVRPQSLGGYELDAQWNDDFHHALHTLLTGESDGYYVDFGRFRQFVKAFQEGFAYSGDYSAFRRRRHGDSSREVPADKFVICTQNHDQIGNRMLGDRLSQLVSFEKLKFAAGALLLSPFIPLLFMGEEYGETAPFQYFVSHLDSTLIEAVRQGRRAEFAEFAWQGEVPDPQDESTFLHSKLNPSLRIESHHQVIYRFHKELLRLRAELPALSLLSKEHMEVVAFDKEKILFVRRWSDGMLTTEKSEVFIGFNFSDSGQTVNLTVPNGNWHKRLYSAEGQWTNPGDRPADSGLPADLTSDGEVPLSLEPYAVFLYSRKQ